MTRRTLFSLFAVPVVGRKLLPVKIAAPSVKELVLHSPKLIDVYFQQSPLIVKLAEKKFRDANSRMADTLSHGIYSLTSPSFRRGPLQSPLAGPVASR
jgi:hypothetical protein